MIDAIVVGQFVGIGALAAVGARDIKRTLRGFHAGAEIVRITAAFSPVLGVVFVFQNFLRNVSDVTPTVVMSFAEIFSRGVLPFVLSAWCGYYGIWWATPIGWVLSLLIGVVRYWSGAWKKKALEA